MEEVQWFAELILASIVKKPYIDLKNNYDNSHQFIFIVFVDSDGSTCSKATFTFGGGSTSRKYDIKVCTYLYMSPRHTFLAKGFSKKN